MARGALERRLHLHLAELTNGEVEVLDGGSALVRVVLEQQVGEIEAYVRAAGADLLHERQRLMNSS